jgi:hypothetical protein
MGGISGFLILPICSRFELLGNDCTEQEGKNTPANPPPSANKKTTTAASNNTIWAERSKREMNESK